MSGLSNVVMKISHPDCQTVLYRLNENDLADSKFEEAIFAAASEAGVGPKLLYQGDGYRMESFFEGRPLTIWEMRNPYFLLKFADIIFQYNFNTKMHEAAQKVVPQDKNSLYID